MKSDITIIHAHIFKNAGSTIDWILEKNFGQSFHDNREDQRMRSEHDYLAKILRDNDFKAISSHSMPLPIKPIEGHILNIIVMLRHPLLRIRSVYDFEHKQKADTLGAIHAKKYSFSEYVAWRMKPEVPPTIRNIQTRYLTHNSVPRVESMGAEHLESAIDFIKKNPLIGIVEDFDQSMVIFHNELKSHFPKISFSYKKQNVTQTKQLSAEQKIDQLKSELGTDLYNKVLEKNQLDIQLYQRALSIVEQRFKEIDPNGELLKKFRETNLDYSR